MLSALKALLWLILAAFFILFAANNRDAVLLTFQPFAFSLALPPWLILFVGIFFGLVLAGLVTGWYRLQAYVLRRQAERRRAAAERDLADIAEKQHAVETAQALDIVRSGQD